MVITFEKTVKGRGPPTDRRSAFDQARFGHLKLLLEVKSLLFFWINLKIHDFLSLCLPQQNPSVSYFVRLNGHARCACCLMQRLLHMPSTYLHVVFALHQVRQSVKPAHGQHKQGQTDGQKCARTLGHIRAACAFSVNWAALTEQSAKKGYCTPAFCPSTCMCNII